jgi:hypothetical protein
MRLPRRARDVVQNETTERAMPGAVSDEDVRRAQGEVVPHRYPEDPPAKKPPHRFQPGNKFGYKHGAYSSAFVQSEEKEQFISIRNELVRDFGKETGVDTMMFDVAALLFMRHGRAVLAGEQDLANKTLASILAMLDRLKATKISREGDKPVRSEMTPAQWASKLLASASDKKPATEKPPVENAEKTSDNSQAGSENAGDIAGEDPQDVR